MIQQVQYKILKLCQMQSFAHLKLQVCFAYENLNGVLFAQTWGTGKTYMWRLYFGQNAAFILSKRWSSLSYTEIAACSHDVCGPMQTPSFGNYLYFVTFIDDFSRHAWIHPLKAKSKVFMYFKQFLVLAENMSACKLGTLCSYRRGEYMSSYFNSFLAEHGIKHQSTVPYTPQQNGVAERKNMSLMEMARCMVKSQALPHSCWLEAVMCATYVLNRCPTKALQSITPYEAWHGRKPSVAHLHVFGCLAYALVRGQHRKKLDDKAVKWIFVGYGSESKGYRLYHPQTKCILVSRDVVFVEDAIQSLLSSTKETSFSSKDLYDTLLPLFTCGQSSTGTVEASSQPL